MAPNPHQRDFTLLKLQANAFTNDLFCNKAAISAYQTKEGVLPGQIYVLSAVGTQAAIRSLHACLKAKDKPEGFGLMLPLFLNRAFPASVVPAKHRCAIAPLALDAWHLMLVAEDSSLMFDDSDDALWNVLRSEKYTTPVLRHWMPELRRMLTKTGAIQPTYYQLNCNVTRLSVSTKSLDEIVSIGLKNGTLKIESDATK